MRGYLTLWYLEEMAVLREVCALTTQHHLTPCPSGRHHHTALCGQVRDKQGSDGKAMAKGETPGQFLKQCDVNVYCDLRVKKTE